MFSINGGELLVLVVVALVVLGPERLPHYAQQLGRLVREVRSFALKAREQVREEMGEDFDDIDWQALDPRRYDPRRIVRDALFDGDDDPLGFSDSGPHVPEAMRRDGGTAPRGSAEGATSGGGTTASVTEGGTEGGAGAQAYDADAT